MTRASAVTCVIFDVDDVLVEMDEVTLRAERAVVAPLLPLIGAEAAERVRIGLTTGYATLRDQLRAPAGVVRPDYAQLRARIEGWQRGVVEAGHEIKQWSRDTLLAIALEDVDQAPDATLIRSAMDAYWGTMAREGQLFADARALLSRLRARGVPFHLATNSDGFLVFDAPGRTFRYDPRDAAERKLARLRALVEDGLMRSEITIGDPIGKPRTEFYHRVFEELEARLGRGVDRAGVLAVGDSFTNDVLPLLALGAGQGALLDRSRQAPGLEVHPDDERVQIVRDLVEVGTLVLGPVP